jgi:putative Mn2+ efflux pump MntP
LRKEQFGPRAGGGLRSVDPRIGLATCAMTTRGVVLGERYGRIAETLGGAGMIAIAVKMLAG